VIKPKLHHVTLKTSRLDEMITWYGAVIGAKVQFRDQTAAWTTNDEANHRIAFLAPPGLSDDGESGATTACIIAPSSMKASKTS
jgi:catechol 2,3-dioxygenase